MGEQILLFLNSIKEFVNAVISSLKRVKPWGCHLPFMHLVD